MWWPKSSGARGGATGGRAVASLWPRLRMFEHTHKEHDKEA